MRGAGPAKGCWFWGWILADLRGRWRCRGLSVPLMRYRDRQRGRSGGQPPSSSRSHSKEGRIRQRWCPAVEGLLTRHGVKLADIGAIVVVHGPGSFTGIRVGVSAVKGLAEPGRIPVVAVSRLAVLAAKAGVGSAALDAHRHEVFLRVAAGDGSSRQLLAGAEELAQIYSASSPVPKSEGPGAPSTNLSHISESRCGAPSVVAVCDDAAAEIVEAAWGGVELRRVEAPTAADAIRLCAAAILAGEFADLALLDGHYLRRSDAEIFGESAKSKSEKGAGIRVRRMEAGDIDAVMEIASKTDHAPRWGRSAYEAAIDAGNQPRRVALVAERDGAALAGFVVAAVLPAERRSWRVLLRLCRIRGEGWHGSCLRCSSRSCGGRVFGK